LIDALQTAPAALFGTDNAGNTAIMPRFENAESY
jgi:hypothetical protein